MKEWIEAGHLEPRHVPGKENPAGLLTKVVDVPTKVDRTINPTRASDSANFHIAPNKKGEEGGYEKERGNGNYRQPTTDDVGEFGSSARLNKLTRQMK